MKKSIFEKEEYYKIFKYIVMKKKARSYEITKEFGRKRDNLSKQLQTLKQKGLIKVIKTSSRGRHGKYSEYIIDNERISKYFILRFKIYNLYHFYQSDCQFSEFDTEIITGLKILISGRETFFKDKNKDTYTLNLLFEELASFLMFEGISRHIKKNLLLDILKKK